MPKDIIKKFQDQYGEKKGKEVYYATANKQGRNPETFEKVDEFVSYEKGSNDKEYNNQKYNKLKKVVKETIREVLKEYSVGGYSNTGGYSADMGGTMMENDEYVPMYKSCDHSTFDGINYHLKECGVNTRIDYVEDGGQRMMVRRDHLPLAIDTLKNTLDEVGSVLADKLQEKYFKQQKLNEFVELEDPESFFSLMAAYLELGDGNIRFENMNIKHKNVLMNYFKKAKNMLGDLNVDSGIEFFNQLPEKGQEIIRFILSTNLR